MAQYIKYQNNNKMSKAYGKWYARPKVTRTMGLDEVARRIQKNVSVKTSDVRGVLEELADVLTDALADGYRVKIDGIGAFKPSLKCKGELTPEDVTAASITTKMVFQPEVKVDSQGHRIKRLIADVTWQEAIDYARPKSETEGDGGEQQP